MVKSVHVEREDEQGQEREKENKQKLKDAIWKELIVMCLVLRILQ